MVKVLIERGAAVEKMRRNDGATPLYVACDRGYVEVAEILIEARADVNVATTEDGATPLYIACQGGG